MFKKIILPFFLVLTQLTYSQIAVNNTVLTPFQIVNNVLTGSGLTVSNVTFNGSAILANTVQSQVGTFNANGTGFPLANGIVMGSGNVQFAVGPNNTGSGSNNTGVAPDPNDPDLFAISGQPMNNEAILEFDFVPQGTQISFNYIFGSEEYHEFSTSNFNDAFGFFLSGPGIAGPYTNGAINIAVVPGTTTPVSMNTINNGGANTGPCTNCGLLIDNAGGTAVQYDAYTVTLQASASVQCGQTYHIKLAIGDALDWAWDSGMFLQSFVSNPVDVTILSNEGCLGDNDGSITTTVNSGQAPYNFVLTGPTSGSNSTGNFNNLAPGLYTLTVTDALNCPVNVDFIINPGVPCCTVTATGTNPSCNGGNDGTATANPSGGIAPYTYQWSNGQTTQNATGLSAGSYTVDITDASGCTSTANVSLTDPPALNANLTPTNVSCFGGANGQIAVNASGGTPGYTYSINGGAFQSGSTFTGLIAGNYTITVKDNKGCTIVVNQAITEPTDLTLVETNNQTAACGMSNGQTTVSAAGGTGTYTYDLGGTTNTTGNFTGLASGNYSITVTDGNGCTENINIIIGNSPAPVPVVDASSAVACAGGFNGSVSVSVSGGQSPFTYSLDGGASQSSNTFTLPAGAHTITVTDVYGCTGSVNFNITEPTPLVYNTTITPTTCNGDCDGQIAINASGSNGGYTYSVDGGPFLSSSTITGLCAGNHNIVVQDVNGCSSNSVENVPEPAPIASTFTHVQPSCYGICDGEIHLINTSGGDGNFTFSVDNGTTFQNTPDFLNMCAQDYDMIVEDGNGCQFIFSDSLTTPPQITFTTAFNNPSNCGSNDGAFSMFANNGTPDYNYTIHNNDYSYTAGPQLNNGAFPNLYSGLYTIVVTDNNGCQDSSFVGLSDIQMTSTLQFSQDLTCYHSDDGVGVVTVTAGGVQPITYVLNTFTTGAQVGPQNNGSFGGLPAGDHTITITDNGGVGACTNIIQFTLTEPDTIQFNAAATDVSCPSNATNIVNDGIITFNNAVGGANTTYEYSIDGGVTYQASPNFTGLAPGSYTLFVRDPNGCEGQSTIDINQPTDFSVITNITDLTCNGDNTGFMQVFASGGTANYTYDLNGTSNSTGIFAGLAANPNYNITITDNLGCTFSATDAVNEPPVLTANYVVTDATCNGLCNGEVLINANGGTPNYLYSPDNGVTYQAGNNLTGLCAGNHQIQVKDDHNCVVNAVQVINEPTLITFNMTSTPATCGNDNATVTITANNGTPNYQYSASSDNGLTFTPLQATNTITNLPATNTIVMVTDANSCEVTQNINLTADPQPQIDLINSTDPLCNGDNNGSIIITASNGVTPYQYSIDNGTTFQNPSTFNNLVGGSYDVVVEDNNGCQVTTNVVLTEPAALTLNINGTDLLCNGDYTGEVNAVAAGGTSPYSYSIDGGATTQSTGVYSNLPAGNYTVDVTDFNGCTLSGNQMINEPAPLVWTQFTYNTPTCFGDCDITITTATSGGTTPYTYDWSNNVAGSNDAVASNVCSDNYSVLLTDAHGCQLDSLNFDIFDPTPIIFDLDVTNVSCHPNNGINNNGVIDIIIPAQTTPLSLFSFEGGSYQTVTNYPNLNVGLYTVYGQNDNGCTTYYTTNVYQPDELFSGVPNDTLVCSGTELIIEADSATGGTHPYVYNWSSNGVNIIQQDSFNLIVTSDSTLDLTVIDSNNCVVNYSFDITIPPTLTIVASADQTICPGTSSNVSAVANGGSPNYSYLWLTGNPADTLDNLTVTPTQDPSQYIITVTDECNETAQDTVVIDFFNVPPPMIVGGGLGCLPYQAELLSVGNIVQNGGNVTWNLGDGTIISNQDSVSHLFESEGCYDITLNVTTADGCVYDSTFTDLVCVNPNPTAQFDYTPALPTVNNQVVQFNNLSSNATSYQWSFGNFGSSSEENPQYEFFATEQSTYDICLVAISDYGCTDTVCYPITIYDELLFYVPNVFTPDHDDFNEVFKPVFTSGFDPYDYHLTIFNRWGEIVFESYNAQVGWDGTFNGGEICQDGVYVWQISFGEIISDKEQMIRGHVTLLK